MVEGSSEEILLGPADRSNMVGVIEGDFNGFSSNFKKKDEENLVDDLAVMSAYHVRKY